MLPPEMALAQLASDSRGRVPTTAGALLSIPANKLTAALAQMDPADIARLLPGVPAKKRAKVIMALPPTHLTPVMECLPAEEAHDSIASLSDRQHAEVVSRLSDPAIADLLDLLPPTEARRMLDVVSPLRAESVLARRFESAVARVLGRANIDLSPIEGAPPGVWLASGPRMRLVVVASQVDDGRVMLRHVELATQQVGIPAALCVSGERIADDVHRYVEQVRRSGYRLEIMTWSGSRDDTDLLRRLAVFLS
ncbi:hypothetical protein [Actinoplanes sp. NPDC051851]|uniref:magnesium transporter MgtE N-terminal domain-containing protein n=1 Tax=Actinoplanes sp. NPDC051851 TaxID=3154753 RepID=UPI0034261C65